MRLPLIACIILVTGFTFFAATRSIDAKVENVAAQSADAALMPLRAEVENSKAALTAATAAHKEELERLKAEYQNKSDNQQNMGAALEKALAKVKALEDKRIALSQSNEELNAKLALANTSVGDWENQISDARATISELTGTMQDSQSKVETLETELSTLKSSLSDANQQAEIFKQRIAELETESGSTAETDTMPDLAEFEALAEEKETALAESEVRIAALLNDVDAQVRIANDAQERALGLETRIEKLEQERQGLIQTVSLRDEEIEELRASVIVPRDLTPGSCTAATDALLVDEKIAFDTGTAVIGETSAALLDKLADVAFDCAYNDMTVTIGGHTDSRGGERSNQALSEQRAAAVRNFFGTRGLPSASMQVVGYGESQPIADNETSEGRAENRRITFEWQKRELAASAD